MTSSDSYNFGQALVCLDMHCVSVGNCIKMPKVQLQKPELPFSHAGNSNPVVHILLVAKDVFFIRFYAHYLSSDTLDKECC